MLSKYFTTAGTFVAHSDIGLGGVLGGAFWNLYCIPAFCGLAVKEVRISFLYWNLQNIRLFFGYFCVICNVQMYNTVRLVVELVINLYFKYLAFLPSLQCASIKLVITKDVSEASLFID